ncbi:hypothetical protein CEXT_103351 [Caerostris extrusa]|uniref:Transposase n=1 Tax=Caerostris extrusa TaxID=172846 RepID=A0AAV4SDE2_CAEEX|nr:hypothetical protein CEXT_103351 [Caerostris extrusa]
MDRQLSTDRVLWMSADRMSNGSTRVGCTRKLQSRFLKKAAEDRLIALLNYANIVHNSIRENFHDYGEEDVHT